MVRVSTFFTVYPHFEVLATFIGRRDGARSSIRVKLLENIHFVAYIKDPNIADGVDEGHRERFQRNAAIYEAGFEV